jgi:hypothetical protein
MSVNVHAQGGVRDYVRAARGLYEDLEFERALEQLSRARPFSTGPADDALLSLYEGIILADLNKMGASTAAFKAALYLQPDAKLPVSVSPKVAQRFETLRAQVKRDQVKRGAQYPDAVARPVPPAVSAPASQATQASLAMPVTEVSGSSGMRGRAWLPATVGGVLLVGGGVSYALARSEHSRLRDNDASLATLQDAERSASRGRTFQAVGLGLVGAGLVGLGLSAGMYLLERPSEPAKVGFGVSTDGTSAFVFGRWP